MTENLNAIELTTGVGQPRHAIIWLHGLGADGNDFAPLVPELEKLGIDDTRFIFPHAPEQPITINGGMHMRAWYDITSLQFEQRSQDIKGIQDSQAIVEQLIADQQRHGISPGRIMLAGFSQGGAVALYTGLRHADSLAGIIALSTYLPGAEQLEAEKAAANLTTPIFMAHGAADDVIAQSIAEASRDAMTSLGYDIEWHSYPMAHTLIFDEVRAIAEWIQRTRG